MPESSQELFMPTNQEIQEANKPKVEPSLFTKTIKRLKTSGQIAMLSVVLATACDKADKQDREPNTNHSPQTQQTIDNMPSQETVTDHQSEIQKLKTEIGLDKTSSPEQKNLTTEALNRYEIVYQNIDKLVQVYEANKTNGEPTLLTQQREKYGHMDFSPIWNDKYKNQDEFLKDQIFFLHDQKIIKQTIEKMTSSQNLTNIEIEDTIAQNLADLDLSDSIYLEVNSQNEAAWNFDPNISQEVVSTLSDVKPLSNVRIRVEPGFSGAKFTPYPPTITMGEGTPAEIVIHEAGHATDIVENPNILKNISPEKAIEIYIARNKAILETRQYDNYEEIFSESRLNASRKIQDNEPLTQDELNAGISYLSNRILTNPTSGRGSQLTENVFAQHLKSQNIEDLKLGTNLYKTNQEFMAVEAANLARLADQNPFFKITIDAIKANPDLFENYYGGANQEFPVAFSGRPAQNYYDTLQAEFAPAVLFTRLMQNDPEIMSSFPEAERESILEKVILQAEALEREQIAEGFHEAVLNGRSEAFTAYLQALSN